MDSNAVEQGTWDTVSISGCGNASAALPAQAIAAPAAPSAPSAIPNSSPSFNPAIAIDQAVDGAANTPLQSLNAQGNTAAAISPEDLEAGKYTGDRLTELRVGKSNMKILRGRLKSKHYSKAEKAQFRKELKYWRQRVKAARAGFWLTNLIKATGGRSDVVKQLDDTKLRVVSDKALLQDAAYSEKDDAILIKESAVKSILKNVHSLDKQGMVNFKTGSITDPAALKGTEAYRKLVGQAALIGAHEAGHASDAHRGELHHDTSALRPLAQQVAAGGTPEQESDLLHQYLSTVEYDSYLAQERFHWEMGVAPKSMKWMTIDNQGNPIDRTTAVTNITNFLGKAGFTADAAAKIVLTPSTEPGKKVWGKKVWGKKVWGDELAPGKKVWGKKVWGEELAPGKKVWGKKVWGEELAPGKKVWGSLLDSVTQSPVQQSTTTDSDRDESQQPPR